MHGYKNWKLAFFIPGLLALLSYAPGRAFAAPGDNVPGHERQGRQPGPEQKGQEDQRTITWDMLAEEVFGIGKGEAKELMTEEQFQEHLRKMQSMSDQEIERYRGQVHARLMEKAIEKGLEPSPEEESGPNQATDVTERR